jgi:hypothetical protein
MEQGSAPKKRFRKSSSENFVDEARQPSLRLNPTAGNAAGDVRYSILPILIGDGIPFFDKLDRDIALHLAEVKAYESGMVELRYEVRG